MQFLDSNSVISKTRWTVGLSCQLQNKYIPSLFSPCYRVKEGSYKQTYNMTYNILGLTTTLTLTS